MRTELTSDLTMNGITSLKGKPVYSFTVKTSHMGPRIEPGDTLFVDTSATGRTNSILVYRVNDVYVMGMPERDSKARTSYLRQADGRRICISDSDRIEYVGIVIEMRCKY